MLVVLPAARYVPRQQGASAVLLAVEEFLFADVEDKGIECFELGLLDECRLVACHESWVFQTFASHLCDLRELSAPCSFFLGNRCSTLATYRSVFAFGKLAVVVGGAVLLRDFTRDVMNRVFVGYYSHNVFGNEQEYDNKNYKQLDPKLSNISWNLFKTIQVNFDVN